MKVKKTLSLILACLMFSSFAAACNDDGDVVEYAGTGPGTASTPTVGGGSGYGSVSTGSSTSPGNVSGMEEVYQGNTGSGNSNVNAMERLYLAGILSSLGKFEDECNTGLGEGYYGTVSGSPSDWESTYKPNTSTGGDISDLEDSYVEGNKDTGSYGNYDGSMGPATGPVDGHEQTGTTNGSDTVITGGNTGNFENGYSGDSEDGNIKDFENGENNGGFNSDIKDVTGNLTDFESGVDNTYHGATELVADSWRDVQGYNYYYHSQLGPDVMPIGGWCAPPSPYETKGFTTNQITLENYQTVAASGINSIYGLYDRAKAPAHTDIMNALNYADQVGVVYMVKDASSYGTIAMDGVEAIDDNFYSYMAKPAYGGTLFVDEPGYIEFERIGQATQYWRSHDLFGKTKLALVNNLPNYASAAQLYHGAGTSLTSAPIDYKTNYKQWVERYIQMVNPQVFSYDFYPFNGVNTSFDALYYQNLSDVRQVCVQYNVPFWTFAQIGSWAGTRNFSYAEIAFQMHTVLAYGAKGVQWFNYWQPLEMSNDNVCAFVDHYGNKTKYWDYGVKINKQIAAVDHVLMKSKSMGVIKIGNTIAPMPQADLINNYAVLTSTTGSSGDAIVGCFEYREQGYAYYIASNSVTNGATVKLNFNGTYSLEKIQDATSTKTTANSITVNVPAGEGVLVVVNK